MANLAGVLGIITGLISVVMSLGIVFWWIYWSYRKKQLQYHERQLMIERGLMPPPVLPEQSVTPEGSLRRGIVTLCVGLGIGLAALVAASQVEQELGGLMGIAAAIVASLGLGNLAYYLIARRRGSTPEPAGPA